MATHLILHIATVPVFLEIPAAPDLICVNARFEARLQGKYVIQEAEDFRLDK